MISISVGCFQKWSIIIFENPVFLKQAASQAWIMNIFEQKLFLADVVLKRELFCIRFFNKDCFIVGAKTVIRYMVCCAIWCHLCNLKKHEKHPSRSVTFSKVTGFSCSLLHGCFSRFFKLYKWYQIAQRITYDLSENFFLVMIRVSMVLIKFK